MTFEELHAGLERVATMVSNTDAGRDGGIQHDDNAADALAVLGVALHFVDKLQDAANRYETLLALANAAGSVSSMARTTCILCGEPGKARSCCSDNPVLCDEHDGEHQRRVHEAAPSRTVDEALLEALEEGAAEGED